jgi:uncharacterized membrane protein
MQILDRKHPLYFVASACICVGAAAVIWHLAGESWQTEAFWKTAAFSLAALLAVLTAVLFRAVSRMYPGLNPFSSKP